MQTRYYDFKEDFVLHFYNKYHQQDKSLSLEEIKKKIIKKWDSYQIEELRDFFIIYCLNKNLEHIDKDDLGYKDWFSEAMCLKFSGKDDKQCRKFCKERHKQFKDRTLPQVLSFRIQYEQDMQEEIKEKDFKTPEKKHDINKEKHLIATAIPFDEEKQQKITEKPKRFKQLILNKPDLLQFNQEKDQPIFTLQNNKRKLIEKKTKKIK